MIQMDGAGPHANEWVEQRLTRMGARRIPKIVIDRQTAQSPDLNLNDRGGYTHLASIVEQCDYRTERELVAAIEKAWHAWNGHDIDRLVANLECHWCDVVQFNGGTVPKKGRKHKQLGIAQKDGGLWQFVAEYCSQDVL